MESRIARLNPSPGTADSIDPRLDSESKRVAAALDEFLALGEQGKAPSHAEFLARYPDIADRLLPCLESLDLLQVAANFFASPGNTGVEDRSHELGDFKLIAEIGRGGMGIVYEAEQLSLGRRVAVKVLPFAALLDRRRLERFQNEARAAAMLRHPRIVSVHAVDCQRGVRFYAMDLIEGRSLAEVISATNYPLKSSSSGATQKTPLATTSETRPRAPSPSDSTRLPSADTRPIAGISTQVSNDRAGFYHAVAELGIQVAEGLQYAHEQGIVHRDIKPSNLLLDEQGHVHIADFGLALVQDSSELTLTGDVVGTLRYMSPEQLAQSHTVGPPTDVYSLGATLYETLGGLPAVAGETKAEVIRNVAESAPRSLRSIDSRIPADLATIVHKCLAKTCDDRYASAQELADDLRRFRQHRPILAKRSPLWKHGWRWAKRHRPLAAAIAVALLALTTLAIAGPLVAIVLLKAVTSEQLAMSRLEAHAYDMRIRDAASAIRSAHYGRAEAMLAQCDPQDRDFEWHHLWNQVEADRQRTIAQERIALMRVALSSNGKQVAYADWFGSVQIHDRDQRKRIDAFSIPPSGQAIPLGLEFSPNGKWLFAGGEQHAVLWDVERREVVARWTTSKPISAAAISPDSRTLALGFMSDVKATAQTLDPVTIKLFEIPELVKKFTRAEGSEPAEADRQAPPGIALIGQLSGPLGRIHSIAFAPDGYSLAACSNEPNTIRRWAFPSLSEQSAITVDEHLVEQFAYMPNRSDVMAVAGGVRSRAGDRSNVSLYSAASGDRIRLVHGSNQATHAIGFSPDAQRLAIGDQAGRVLSWRTAELLDPATDAVPTILHPHQARTYDMAVTNSESVITVAADGYIKESRLDPVDDALRGYSTFAGGLALVDEEFAVSWGYDVEGNHLKLWRLSDGTLVKALDTGPIHVTDVEVLPSGNEIAYTGFSWRADPVRAEIGIWGLVTNARQILYESPNARTLDVELSDENDQLFATMGSRVIGIDLAHRDSHQETSFDSRRHVPIARQPGGNLFAVAETSQHPPHRIVFWNPNRKVQMAPLRTGNDTIWSLAFSPTGKLVAGTDTGDILLWHNIRQPTPPQRLAGHVANAYHVCFSPSGTRFASAGLDGTVRLWNANTGNEVLHFATNTAWNYHVTFSADGQTLAYSGGNGTFHAPIRFVHGKVSEHKSVPSSPGVHRPARAANITAE